MPGSVLKPDDDGYTTGWRAACRDGENVRVDLIYPRNNPAKAVIVGLEDVRAADEILIRYDFNRDGWAIFQASKFSWDCDDKICDPDWQEVAFIQAWAREKEAADAG